MNKHDVIAMLGLEPHVEGGYFRRTYTSGSELRLERPGGGRPLLTTIHYLLTDDSPVGCFHRNRSDILHFFHAGWPLTYLLISPSGELERHLLGPDLNRGHRPQLLVRGGVWKATVLEAGPYGLVSEAVAPGFDYRDMELARPESMRAAFPQLWERIAPYVRGAARGPAGRVGRDASEKDHDT
ncbi:MAG TPA: cupin domain-containing protein [Gammaproteobacteria bacterium]|nr:cupin domain-containing protein [Gammaproteobacteria bacterium]